MPLSPDLARRLIAEAREDDARMATSPWSAKRGKSDHRGEVYESSSSAYEHIATVHCGAFDGHGYPIAEAIARTRNNLAVMADQLEAALAECERLREVDAVWRADFSRMTADRDRLAAELERMTRDRDSYANSNFERQLDEARAELQSSEAHCDALRRGQNGLRTELQAAKEENERLRAANHRLRSSFAVQLATKAGTIYCEHGGCLASIDWPLIAGSEWEVDGHGWWFCPVHAIAAIRREAGNGEGSK